MLVFVIGCEVTAELLYLRHGSLQTAVNQAAEIIRSAVVEFDALSKQLLAKYSADADADAELHAMLEQYIDGLQHACTASITWGLSTRRYQVGTEYVEGGLKVTFD
ncbi:hypothetical protein VTN77DRAFT_9327 [Rasamsonia byssochlamydoides]|uniref:uncharacterized protein n=1 Tax=Rasamsonia byssochlamydoides TaxID=89139 RepID=UPI003742F462